MRMKETHNMTCILQSLGIHIINITTTTTIVIPL
jgi:hypothetical protein